MNVLDLLQENENSAMRYSNCCIRVYVLCGGRFPLWFYQLMHHCETGFSFFLSEQWKVLKKLTDEKRIKTEMFMLQISSLPFSLFSLCRLQSVYGFFLLAYTHNWLFIFEIKSLWQGLIALCSSEKRCDEKSSDLKERKYSLTLMPLKWDIFNRLIMEEALEI